jgi:hypothetical protein
MRILKRAPINISLINIKLNILPENILTIIKQDNFDFKDSMTNTLKTYLLNKAFYNRLFTLDDKNRIDSIDSFIDIYKYLQKQSIDQIEGYNFCIKLYNNKNKKYVYLYLVDKSIIKINNVEPFSYIEDRLSKKNMVINKSIDSKIILSYGNYIDLPLNKKKIETLFKNTKNKLDLTHYNYIKIMYWISSQIM